VALSQRVVSSRFPYLPLRVRVGQRVEDVEALLDTGFDGQVILPAGLLNSGDPPDYFQTWTLADGSEVVAPAFLGSAQVGTLPPFSVVVTVLGGEPLVGREVSDRFRITLDHGQQVIVEL
jgi:predicted aspartyl protease